MMGDGWRWGNLWIAIAEVEVRAKPTPDQPHFFGVLSLVLVS